jgi:lysophospholipase L1-like esterase
MIALAHAENIQIILLAVPQKSIFLTPAPLYQQLAQQYELVFIENIITDLLNDSDYKSDRVHFNTLGYEQLAQRIHQVMNNVGML